MRVDCQYQLSTVLFTVVNFCTISAVKLECFLINFQMALAQEGSNKIVTLYDLLPGYVYKPLITVFIRIVTAATINFSLAGVQILIEGGFLKRYLPLPSIKNHTKIWLVRAALQIIRQEAATLP